ncbi:MAG: ROK family protein [bacterium]|nr:ROK family protein [bacterium]
MRRELFAGIDIGGTTTEALVVPADGGARGYAELPSGHGGEATVTAAVAALDAALETAGAGRSDLEAVGLGVPGHVDHATGDVRLAVNLDIDREGFPLGAKVASELGVPIAVDHDMRIAALGAYNHLRSQRPIEHLAFIGVGTGLSAGLILNQQVFRGSSGFAGEIGHIVVDPAGLLCACGLNGCLETFASGSAIERALNQTGVTTTAALFAAADAGDRLAAQVSAKLTHHLAWAVHLVTMTYDVDVIVLGGGVVAGNEAVEARVREELARLRATSVVAHSVLSEDRLTTLPEDFHPGVEGAVALARHTIENNQKPNQEEVSE